MPPPFFFLLFWEVWDQLSAQKLTSQHKNSLVRGWKQVSRGGLLSDSALPK